MEPTIKPIPLAAIRIDGETQARTEINYERVREMTAAIGEGATIPPIMVFYDGKDYWLADGYHRWHAAKAKSFESIDCEVVAGSLRDARLFPVSRGLMRTKDDKRAAVMLLLNDEEWSKWSNETIAGHCGVSISFVRECRGVVKCDDCHEMFPDAVWHCPHCGAHYPSHVTNCHNCYLPNPVIPTPDARNHITFLLRLMDRRPGHKKAQVAVRVLRQSIDTPEILTHEGYMAACDALHSLMDSARDTLA